jgi:lipopolysaccharide transport system ATP-binding protein
VITSDRISALLELGSGFNPDFTGRQNVMLNGQILGFSRRAIEAKMDEILAFSEIGDFVHRPIKTYSSGMLVRLAFAAAIVWEPEILIVDEALAVGDVFFQQKCFARIKALQEQGTTILFVSHDTQAILNLCQRAVLLDHGQLVYLGDAPTAIERYYELHYSSYEPDRLPRHVPDSEPAPAAPSRLNIALPLITDFSGKNRYGKAVGLIEGVSITDFSGKARAVLLVQTELVLSIKLGPHAPNLAPLNIGFHLRDRLGQLIIGINTHLLGHSLAKHPPGQALICQFRFRPQIAPGEYTLDVAVAEDVLYAKTIYDWINNALSLSLTTGAEENDQGGICRPDITVDTYDASTSTVVQSSG